MMRGNILKQAIVAGGLVATLAGSPAEARRGGSFGSRGSRTYYAPASTRLAPGYTAPVSRSMTERPVGGQTQYAPSYGSAYRGTQYGAGRPRFGFGGGLFTGLLAGGLIGSMFGHGWGGGGFGGGGGGMMAALIQIAILAGIVWLAFRLFRGRASSAPSGFGQRAAFAADPVPPAAPFGASAPPPPGNDIVLDDGDQQVFERLLIELQDAFGHEDYARLRAITTPEVMSYLAEELSDNATHGRRNAVTATRLLDGEVSEAWQEGAEDYATIVLRYESVDVMRDRSTDAILSGSPSIPTETTELWTFVRPAGVRSAWKVSAIQEA